MIHQIEELYFSGKRAFAVVTHCAPDPDAAAGALGMKHLLQLILPHDAEVRLMLEGDVGKEFSRNGRFCVEPIEQLRTLYGSEQSARKSALVLVDQPTIKSKRVLSSSILGNDELFLPREADIVLDHHNGVQEQGPGVFAAQDAGSTSALILRALQLETERRNLRPQDCAWYKDADLALFMNTGAWTDAGISLSTWDKTRNLPAVVKWVHEETKGRFDNSQVKDFDLSSVFDQFRLHANKTRTVCGPISIDGKFCNVVLAFVGTVSDPNQLGAFTSQYLLEQADLSPGEISMGLAVFGVLRSPILQEGPSDRVLFNEQVKLCVRKRGDVCSDRIAKLISEEAGGGDTSAAAMLRVPLGLHAQHEDTFAGCCLRFLEAKLMGDASLDWGRSSLL
jgi:nanoRNase/pAp phosphatase (c-di-AMP/oligoRNAs hydrolase)